MAVTREKKGEILNKLRDVLKKSKSVVFVNFHGLSVFDTTSLRRKLREEGVNYLVSKKTLAKIALNDSKFEGEMPNLDGELALVFSETEETAPARGVHEFAKKFKDNLKILGGVFGGVFKNMEEMVEIAQIPSQHTLRGMFVNVINSPIQGFVIALSKIAEKKQ
jgi:large subunit ribosomal protein L10